MFHIRVLFPLTATLPLSGQLVQGPDGFVREVQPILGCYIKDYLEGLVWFAIRGVSI